MATAGRVHLVTPRLVLREFTADDVDLVVDLDSDPQVVHYVTGGRGTPRDEVVEEVLPHWLAYYERTPGYGFWAAELRSTGEFIGWFHLRPRPGRATDSPELGYRLRRPAWGRGYATEGSKALVDRAFQDLGVERVLAETMVVNAASRRVMEKVGLRLVRTFHADWPDRIPGDELGDVEYAIERREWERGRRPTLFEYAGGEPAFRALATAHHARCLLDPELNHPFSHPGQHPQHVERLAWYWAEVLGGPPRYSAAGGNHSALVEMHSGNGDVNDLGRRFLECFLLAADDAGLPDDAEFRVALRAYMEWALTDQLAFPDDATAVPRGRPVPRWSWDGLQPHGTAPT